MCTRAYNRDVDVLLGVSPGCACACVTGSVDVDASLENPWDVTGVSLACLCLWDVSVSNVGCRLVICVSLSVADGRQCATSPSMVLVSSVLVISVLVIQCA